MSDCAKRVWRENIRQRNIGSADTGIKEQREVMMIKRQRAKIKWIKKVKNAFDKGYSPDAVYSAYGPLMRSEIGFDPKNYIEKLYKDYIQLKSKKTNPDDHEDR